MKWNNMKHYACLTEIDLMSFSCYSCEEQGASKALVDPQRANAASYFKPEEWEKWSHDFITLATIKWTAWACLHLQNYQNYSVGKIAYKMKFFSFFEKVSHSTFFLNEEISLHLLDKPRDSFQNAINPQWKREIPERLIVYVQIHSQEWHKTAAFTIILVMQFMVDCMPSLMSRQFEASDKRHNVLMEVHITTMSL